MSSDTCKAALVAHVDQLGMPSEPRQWKRRSREKISDGAVVRTFEHTDWGFWTVTERAGQVLIDSPSGRTPSPVSNPLWSPEVVAGARALIDAVLTTWAEDEDEDEDAIERVMASDNYAAYAHALPGWVGFAWTAGDTEIDVSSPEAVFKLPAGGMVINFFEVVYDDPEFDIGSLVHPLLPWYINDRQDEMSWAIDQDVNMTFGEVIRELSAMGFKVYPYGSGYDLLAPEDFLSYLKKFSPKPSPACSLPLAKIKEAIWSEDTQQLQEWMDKGQFNPACCAGLSLPAGVCSFNASGGSWYEWAALGHKFQSFTTMSRHPVAGARLKDIVIPLLQRSAGDRDLASRAFLPVLAMMPTLSVEIASELLTSASVVETSHVIPASVLMKHVERALGNRLSDVEQDEAWNRSIQWSSSDLLWARYANHFQGRTLDRLNDMLGKGDFRQAMILLKQVPADGAKATLHGEPARPILWARLLAAKVAVEQSLHRGFLIIEQYQDGTSRRMPTYEEKEAMQLQAVINALDGRAGPPPRRRFRGP